jgi:hypothetical protein
MLLYPFLCLLSPVVTPGSSKVHLAGWNGSENPLDVYRKGLSHFEEWQSYQGQKNFERQHVVSLIQLPGSGTQWLFAGAYRKNGREEVLLGKGMAWKYDLARLTEYDEVLGRLVVLHNRRGRRTAYRFGDSKDPQTGATFDTELAVHELRAQPLGLPQFPGFKQVLLDFPTLKQVVAQAEPSWRTALSAVSGVYLISDTVEGKLYVGSAGGEAGIWGRWCQYMDGHGGNRELRKLVGDRGVEHAKSFRFSILETADTSASPGELLAREGHWKQVLQSRLFGHNAN